MLVRVYKGKRADLKTKIGLRLHQRLPHAGRRTLSGARNSRRSDDGPALFEAICQRELEGIVAKRVDGVYRPGERGWIKIKNRNYWRYELERESAITKPRVKQFV